MLEKDGSEEFIEDIVDEIIDTSMDKIYKLYLEKQLLPFTVTMAKDAILQVIEVRYSKGIQVLPVCSISPHKII